MNKQRKPTAKWRGGKEVKVTEGEDKKAKAQAEEGESEAQAKTIEQMEKVVGKAAEVEEEEPEEVHEELELREELEKIKAQAAEYLDGWQRTQAEFSNYKKRQGAEQVRVTALANATLLRKLLSFVDDFERAIVTLPANLSQLTWCEGIFLIKHKLDAVLESEGCKPIETKGRAFDPHYHEAVTYEQVSGYDDGQIIDEVQRGYVLGERVLRPALVRVAKAPPAQSEESNDTGENKE